MATKVLPNNGEVGENVGFDCIRRITGYMLGTLDRFNNAKRAEVRDRVKHTLS
ncbi:MAG: ribonucleoside-triphosphate reductase [Lachnospiraceae bacterium]|nr:ribonucleoside-triphosphate reductase [Lachnospiraceae bacterium]